MFNFFYVQIMDAGSITECMNRSKTSFNIPVNKLTMIWRVSSALRSDFCCGILPFSMAKRIIDIFIEIIPKKIAVLFLETVLKGKKELTAGTFEKLEHFCKRLYRIDKRKMNGKWQKNEKCNKEVSNPFYWESSLYYTKQSRVLVKTVSIKSLWKLSYLKNWVKRSSLVLFGRNILFHVEDAISCIKIQLRETLAIISRLYS